MRKKMHRPVTAAIAAAAVCVSCGSQPEIYSQANTRLDEICNGLFPAGEPGAAVLILKGDDVIFEKGYGIADIETKVPIDGDSFFNIASVSKQFTATAVMQLAERGLLSLDDCVGKFHPEYKAEVLLKATNVDGVYDKDPNKFDDAVKYDVVTHSEVLEKDLKVMDSAAASLCRENKIKILVFNLNDPENIIRAVCGENIGTLVKE